MIMKRTLIIWFLILFVFLFISSSIIHEINLARIMKVETQDALTKFEANHNKAGNKTNLEYERKLRYYENEIASLKAKLNELNELVKNDRVNNIHMKLMSENENLLSQGKGNSDFDEVEYKPKSEIDVYSYSAFTLEKWFPAEQHLYKHNVEKLSGERLSDLNSVVNYGLVYLNNDSNNNHEYRLEDFQIGFYRVRPSVGYEYDLYFKSNTKCCSMISLTKPVKSVEVKSVQRLKSDSSFETINFIVPLWGNRLGALNLFLNYFEAIAVKQDDKASTLNIVYLYDHEKQSEVDLKNETRNAILKFKYRSGFNAVKFITAPSKVFSRAIALQIGVERCCNNFNENEIEEAFDNNNNNEYDAGSAASDTEDEDSLLFFCDIDVLFTKRFLDLCRSNSEKLKKVFYPILYSFYNPKIIKALTNSATSLQNLTISKDSGFWRDFGFGMTCQYKLDFLNINGFNDLSQQFNSGWGDEDLFLYRKYVLSNSLQIIRSTTPHIFHLYHEKVCNYSQLNNLQYRHCLESKVLNEASHRHFGLLYFNYTTEN